MGLFLLSATDAQLTTRIVVGLSKNMQKLGAGGSDEPAKRVPNSYTSKDDKPTVSRQRFRES